MKKIFSLVYMSCILATVSAQQGAPLLTNYTESREIENQSWAICQDKEFVMLFANRRGILTFDGQDWNYVGMPMVPYALKYNPQNKKIYVGGENDYGYLERDVRGSYKFTSMAGDSTGIGLITRIIFTDTTVYFYGEQSISRHDLKNKALERRFTQKNHNLFSGMFVTPKNTFINVMSKGLYRLESDTLFPIVTGYLLENDEVLFSLPYDNRLVLLGISNGNLSLFDGIKFYDYQINDDGYLRDNILSDGLTICDSLYAFSTLDGGVLVVGRKSKKIRNVINYLNGLPDDEVFALGTDNNGGLWLSHQYGLTRADLNLPVGNFSIYTGLKGNLITSAWHNNELYVATSEGVFYLTEVKKYSKVEVLIRKDREPGIRQPGASPSEEQGQQKSRKGIFNRIFGKSNIFKKNQTSSRSAEKQIVTPEKISENQYVRKTVSRLKSVNYEYKKVAGLNDKCRQLISSENGLLAAANRGLFRINNHKAEILVNNRYINYISWRPENGKYYVATGDGYFSVKYQNGKWITEYPDKEFNSPVYSIIKTKGDTLWLGGDGMVNKVALKENKVTGKYYSMNIENDYPQRYLLDFINDSVFLFAESGIHFFDVKSKKFLPFKSEQITPVPAQKYLYPLSNMPWVKRGDNWVNLDSHIKVGKEEAALLKIFNEIVSISTDNNNMWVVNGENQLFRIDRNRPAVINPEIDVFVKRIYNEKGTDFSLSDIVLDKGDNIINFNIIAPGYLKQNTTHYQYIVEKLMPEWSPWSINSVFSLIIPDPGTYTLMVRAKDLWGNIGEPKSIRFTLKAPFTRTTGFYLLVCFAGLVLISSVVQFRERQLKKKTRILEEKVKERTAEIEAQKEEITSSIAYASRIQMAMLPVDEHFKKAFSDYFILFKPRDIVSGDFYWIGEDEDHIFFTVADCTGHGVPGAFMSTLGISTLNEIIANYSDLKANTVLNLLREKTKTSLHQTGKEGEAADGMDIAFCILHKNRKLLEYAGAYNSLLIFHEGEFREYRADRMPIGIHYIEKESFTNHEILVKKDDMIYILSDGFSDQIGGPDETRYKKYNLKKLLTKIYDKPMLEQQNILEDEFQSWKGDNDQIDDITIVGVRL
jgi:serine phosphatase RsbU (regulator of sigma subunit)